MHTFPVPEQFTHLWVLGGSNGKEESPAMETGSTLTHKPLVEHLAQAKYPAVDPNYNNHFLFSVAYKMVVIDNEIQPT